MIGKAATKVTISAVVIRKDGTREDLGVIAQTRDSLFNKAFRKLRSIGRLILNGR
jgi:transposase-like protein